MRVLLLISLVFLFSSCVPHNVRTIKKGGQKQKGTLLPFHALPDLGERTLLYRTKIDFDDKHYSGILVIKEISQDDFRIVLMTEVGMKLFDLGLDASTFTVHDCFPALNRKILLSMLESDFRLLLLQGTPFKPMHQYLNSEQNMAATKVKVGNKKAWYLSEVGNHHIAEIHKTALLPVGVRIEVSDYDQEIPQQIHLIHEKIKLIFSLTYLPK